MSAQSTAAPGQDDHLNFGMLSLRVPPKRPDPNTPLTVIVSGVGRSGTSMTAAVISALGIPMGKTKNEAVFEDKEFIAALLYFEYGLMRSLIDKRNSEIARWGFKFPSLQNHLLVPQLDRFRNPHLIIVMRDPVATASRAAMSDPEQTSAIDAFYNVCQQAHDMMYFVQKATCPTLLLSYEKVVAFPEKAIAAIADFLGIKVDPTARARALLAVAPNNPDYIKLFHHDHRGHFHGIYRTHAVGWCSANANDDPVTVELLADGRVIATAKADIFRQDLKNAGIGSGNHSFNIDVSAFEFTEETLLRVQTEGGGFVLEGSDNPLRTMRKEVNPGASG